MHLQVRSVSTLVLSASLASASSLFGKRDSWGPAFSLGPSAADIISTTTTIYPGAPPTDQNGYLFVWLGISNGTGDLIQSIVGSYPAGTSECSGADAYTTWCISSEVYGDDSNGYPNQWVGSLTTADTNYVNGIVINYTLTDAAAYTWTQTMTDAVTGTLLSTYTKNSGPMLGWGTAIELDDYNGVAATGTVSEQTYVNSTITLAAADPNFSSTLGAGTGVVHTGMDTADGGITWTISKITIPAMESSDSSSSSSSVASTSTTTSTKAKVASTTSTSSSVLTLSTSSATTLISSVATSIASSASSASSSSSSYASSSSSFVASTGVLPSGGFNSTSTAFPSGTAPGTAPIASGTAPAKFHHHAGGRHGFYL